MTTGKTIEKTINKTKVCVLREDITMMDIQSFVYYAQHDLKLGSGFGNAITMRGGPKIEKELTPRGPLQTGEAIVSGAGELNAEYIVHAVGPRFQEQDTEQKLRSTVLSALVKASEKGITKIAFPPMGCGFYGVPLALSAKVTMEAFKEHLTAHADFEEVVLCVTDNRETPFFTKALEAIA